MCDGRLPRRCMSCRYSVQVDVGLDCEMLTACVYILKKFERRPCPPGEACTVYERASWKEGGERG